MEQWLCTECEGKSDGEAILRSWNPFRSGDMMMGCPLCGAVNLLVPGCDEPGCPDAANPATMTPQGIRRTCDRHHPNNSEEDDNGR